MAKDKVELIKRALSTSNMTDFIHEDLSDLITMVTPRTVQMFRRLARGKATQSLHEWTERTLTAPSSSLAYNGESALPSATTNTGARRNNQVMQVGLVASATEFLQAQDTVGKGVGLDAFALEMEEKMANLIRAIEYFIFNGDIAQTSPQPCRGLLKSAESWNQIENAASAAALVQTKLDAAIAECYEKGGEPQWIVCTPVVAQRIANFSQDKVRYLPGGGPSGVNDGAFRYLSPFGYELEVLPIRADFMSSGNVLVVDPTKIKYCPMGPAEIAIKDLAVDSDVVAKKLLKAYFTLEDRSLVHHSRITNVANSLT